MRATGLHAGNLPLLPDGGGGSGEFGGDTPHEAAAQAIG